MLIAIFLFLVDQLINAHGAKYERGLNITVVIAAVAMEKVLCDVCVGF